MAESNPVLSIFIPTKNRAQYAVSAIQSVLRYPADDFELVVQDNSESNELSELVRAHSGDCRLRYFHDTRHLDMAENFSAAIERCSGTFLTCWGDDDGAVAEVVEAARWARAQSLDLLTTPRLASYEWPDRQPRYLRERLVGRLDVASFTGRTSRLDLDAELRNCAARGGTLSASRLGGVYRGLVRRKCLSAQNTEIGAYFVGPSPDIGNAISLAPFLEKAVTIDYPLFVPGASLGSAHSAGRADSSELRLENKQQFSSEHLKAWSELVPRFYSGPTIWGETAVQALRATQREDVLEDFDLAYLHANCAVFYPQLRGEILEHFSKLLREQEKSAIIGFADLGIKYFSIWRGRLGHLARNVRRAYVPAMGQEIVLFAPDIEGAVEGLTNNLVATGRTLSSFL